MSSLPSIPHRNNVCGSCGSSNVDLRRKRASNALIMIAYQCLECGRSASPWLKRSAVPRPIDSLPEWDESILERHREQQRLHWAQHMDGVRAKAKEQDDEWWAWYSQYLLTPKWRAKRALVMQRAGGWCEGCRKEEANQVHHLSYAHVGDEFLWELVAICDACHDRIHHAHGTEP